MPYKNKQKRIEYSRQYRLSHPEKSIEYEKKRYWSDPKERCERSRRYRADNQEITRVQKQKYRLTHKDERREAKRRRRAKKAFVNEHFSKKDQEYIFDLFEQKCFNCGSIDRLEVDHIYSLATGHALTRNNACILCRHCNATKYTKEPEDFFSREKFNELMFILFPPYAS